MSVNILADFKENGIDKNEPHIVLYTDNEYEAGMIIKAKLEERGCKVESLIVVEGKWTLQQLHDMANYGIGIEKVHPQMLYVSGDMLQYLNGLTNRPEEVARLKNEIRRRANGQKGNREAQ